MATRLPRWGNAVNHQLYHSAEQMHGRRSPTVTFYTVWWWEQCRKLCLMSPWTGRRVCTDSTREYLKFTWATESPSPSLIHSFYLSFAIGACWSYLVDMTTDRRCRASCSDDITTGTKPISKKPISFSSLPFSQTYWSRIQITDVNRGEEPG